MHFDLKIFSLYIFTSDVRFLVFSQMMVGRQDPAKLENEVKTLRRKKCQSFFSYLCINNAMTAYILISLFINLRE
jgi:hypothetical protein